MANQWVILVGGGYGAFLFDGTEHEAEQMRAHKAKWEMATARKRPADESEVASRKASNCSNHRLFSGKARHYCECGDCDMGTK